MAVRRWRRSCGCASIRCASTAKGEGLDALVHAACARGERSGGVSFYGDVRWVIEGNAPPDPLAKKLDAGSFRFAFEAGTTAPAGDDAAIGEMVAFGGRAYVRSTRLGAPEYFTTVHAPKFRTPAAGIIYPADAVPDAVLSVQRGGRSFLAVANDLHAHIARSCDAPAAAFGGLVTFRELHGVAISRPTIEGENIFENEDKYYSRPAYEGKDVRCVVVGFIADLKVSESRGISGLDALLYEHGDDEAGMPLCLHAHLVTLKPGCEARTAEGVKPEDVDETLHLTTSSVVESMELEAWAITEPLREHPAIE